MIAFCTTCKGRLQHLEQTLPKNLSDNNDFNDLKFIILDYSSQDGMLDYLKNFGDQIASGRLVVYSYRGDHPFRMAHAKNMAHRLGMLEGADILVNLDADNYAGPGFAKYVDEAFKAYNHEIFMWSKVFVPGRDRGISGKIVVSSKSFLKAGGYDEKFDTWSPDDKDFNFRLRRLGCTAVEVDENYILVIRHNDKMRFREYPHVQNQETGEDDTDAIRDSGSTVANFGDVGCGTVYKNFGDDPIELGKVPTRIFGIGMHKTGTTSLSNALNILGLDSAHWENAHWAKAIWLEMTALGRSLTLERHYAMSDLPFTLLYEKLDMAYPGSKFILTTRNEDLWLESVRRHWSHEYNPFRRQWDTDPFTHKIHSELYGRKKFDAEIFLSRFRKHNADVQKYFENRPNDLLTMDLDGFREPRRDPWIKLCGFLNCDIPLKPYPLAFPTMERYK